MARNSMQQPVLILDLFVHIVDNYGDMGFACEFILCWQREYGSNYQFYIWTNDLVRMQKFARQFGISDVEIVDISTFWYLRKSAIWISLLHSPLPDLVFFEEKALILRIDYLSLDPSWIENNEKEHIASTVHRQIIELIPSPRNEGAWLIPLNSRYLWDKKTNTSHITIFAYDNSLHSIDWESFPDNLIIYVFWNIETNRKNIIVLDFLPVWELYRILDTSEFVIIRGEVTFAHMLQTWVPFFWNLYSDLGGFPVDQSEQFLSFLDASDAYKGVHAILNQQNIGKIRYIDCISALSHTSFNIPRTQNLIHTVKKHIDRFNNSI